MEGGFLSCWAMETPLQGFGGHLGGFGSADTRCVCPGWGLLLALMRLSFLCGSFLVEDDLQGGGAQMDRKASLSGIFL